MSKKHGKSGMIDLSTMIAAVRWELKEAEAKAVAEGQDLRFKVEEVELELAMTIEHDQTAKAGIKVMVFELGGEDSKKIAHAHKVKVKLTTRGDGVTRATDDVLVTGEGVKKDPRFDDVPMGG